jgi:hypothetical protein
MLSLTHFISKVTKAVKLKELAPGQAAGQCISTRSSAIPDPGLKYNAYKTHNEH